MKNRILFLLGISMLLSNAELKAQGFFTKELIIGEPTGAHLKIDFSMIGIENSGNKLLHLNPYSGNVLIAPNNSNPIGSVTVNGTRISNQAKMKIFQEEYTYTLSLTEPTLQNTWGISINNNMNFSFNGVLKGSFDGNNGAYTMTSDQRLKTNISPLERGMLQKLMKVEPSTYHFKDDSKKANLSYGYIAQDLEKIFPEVVQLPRTEKDHYLVNYTKMEVITVKAIQELKTVVDEKTTRLAGMEEQLITINETMDELIKEHGL